MITVRVAGRNAFQLSLDVQNRSVWVRHLPKDPDEWSSLFDITPEEALALADELKSAGLKLLTYINEQKG